MIGVKVVLSERERRAGRGAPSYLQCWCLFNNFHVGKSRESDPERQSAVPQRQKKKKWPETKKVFGCNMKRGKQPCCFSTNFAPNIGGPHFLSFLLSCFVAKRQKIKRLWQSVNNNLGDIFFEPGPYSWSSNAFQYWPLTKEMLLRRPSSILFLWISISLGNFSFSKPRICQMKTLEIFPTDAQREEIGQNQVFFFLSMGKPLLFSSRWANERRFGHLKPIMKGIGPLCTCIIVLPPG